MNTTEQNILKEIKLAETEVNSLNYMGGNDNFRNNRIIGAMQNLNMKQAKLEGYQLAQKETAEKVETLKIRLMDIEPTDSYEAIEIVNEVFNDNTKKEAEEK